MKVRVVLMRSKGEKRAPEAVQADRGTEGELFVLEGLASLVSPGEDRAALKWNYANLLRTLYDVELVRMKLDDFMLVGNERDPQTMEPTPQAWWCRV